MSVDTRAEVWGAAAGGNGRPTLVNDAVLTQRAGYCALDNAFALIEGHPALIVGENRSLESAAENGDRNEGSPIRRL